MEIRIMKIPAALTVAAALSGMEELNELEGMGLGTAVPAKRGSVDFVELQHAPDIEQFEAAEAVAVELLKHGIGVKMVCHWPFKGTASWALQTERSRLVSEVPHGGVVAGHRGPSDSRR